MNRRPAPRLLVMLVLVALTTSACIDGSNATDLPAIEPVTFPADAQQQFDAMYAIPPAATPSAAPSAAANPPVERDVHNYDRVGQFLSWQPETPERGRVETSDPGICRPNRSECHRGNIDANRTQLVDDVVSRSASGGSTVTCEGSVDARSAGIGAARQVQLATDRGQDCADLLKRELRAEARERGVPLRVLTTEEAALAGVNCTDAGVTCVEGRASQHVVDACAGKSADRCHASLNQRRNSCDGRSTSDCLRGRGASASVVFASVKPPPPPPPPSVCPAGTKLAGLPIPADGNCNPDGPPPSVCPAGTKLAGLPIPADGNCNPDGPPPSVCPAGTKLAGLPIPADGNCNPAGPENDGETGTYGCVADPSRGVFCQPVTTATSGGNANGANSSNGTPSGDAGYTETDTDFYCEVYPDDCLTAREVLDTVSVRVVLSAPNPFLVGGELREQDIRVTSVGLYCGNSRCTATDGITLETFDARLDLVASNAAKYPNCPTSASRKCAYFYYSTICYQTARTSSICDLRAGFRSATPAGVSVKPTLIVDEVVAALSEYDWVGGTGCNVDVPARTCWSESPGDPVDLLARTSVAGAGSETAVRSGDTFHLSRRVVGTVGS